MENSAINSKCDEDIGKGIKRSKNLQIRLMGHCIICLRKVSTKRNETRSHCTEPEVAPKSMVSTPGFLTTFNQVWTVLQSKWKEKNGTKKDDGSSSGEEIEISLENVLHNGCESTSTNVSFSRAPTICRYCSDKVLVVENLMTALKQQVREITMLLEEGRRRQDGIGGIGDFEKSLQEEGLEDSVIRATLKFVGVSGSGQFSEDGFKVEGNADESANVANMMKMEWDEENSLGNIHSCTDDNIECQTRDLGDDDEDEDPDYVKSEEELEDDDDLSEEEMEVEEEDKNDADLQVQTDPLTLFPEKHKKDNSSPRKWANQFTSSEQMEANKDTHKFLCTCGKNFATRRKRTEHMRLSKEAHPEYKLYGDIKGHLRQSCELCGEMIRFCDILQHLTDHFNGQAEWVIKCPNAKCRFMFASSKNLHSHLRRSIKSAGCNKIWKENGGPVCETCGFKGTNMLGIRNHVRDNHENKRQEKKLRCPISDCGEMFCVKQSVNIHMYEHRYRPITHQNCDKCGEGVEIKGMESHLKDKHEIEEVVGCKQCEMKFSGRDEMVEHLFEHRNAGIFCDSCDLDKFDKYSDFREHYFMVHKLCPKKYKCGEESCDIWFWRKETKEQHDLKTHKRVLSPIRMRIRTELVGGERERARKEFGCDECDDKFITENGLISHKIRVHGAEPFSCDICGETFHEKRMLTKHRKEHVGIVGQKEWKCEVEGCGRIFKKKQLWKHHEEVGHGGEKKHVCEECGKGYSFAATLRQHRDAVHLGLRPWVCDECGERFSNSGVLKRHKLIHTGERPFGCEICGQRFRHKEVLRRHKVGHEEKGPGFKPNGPMKQIRRRKAQ